VVVDPRDPLVWTLSQPTSAVQSRLPVSSGSLLAITRFRYLEAAIDNKTPKRFSTYMAQDLALAEGKPLDSGLIVRLFKTSEDRESSAQVNFGNIWAIFDLYLSKDAVNVNTADGVPHRYIPIHFSDNAGRYIYFVELKFNNAIPNAESWATLATWPDIVINNGMITTRAEFVPTW
jgi:hypothetical protein